MPRPTNHPIEFIIGLLQRFGHAMNNAGAVTALVMLSLGSIHEAQAQERLELKTIPSLDVYEVTEPLRDWTHKRPATEPLAIRLRLGAGFGTYDDVKQSLGIGSLTFGVKTSSLSLAATSSLTLASGSGDRHALRGRHRILAIGRLGDTGDERDLQMTLESWTRHSDRQGFRLDSPGYGFAQMQTTGLALGARARLMHHSHFGLSIPVRYSVERTRFSSAPTLQSNRQTLSMGMGFAPTRAGDVRGTVDAIRAVVEHRSFDEGHFFAAPKLKPKGGLATNSGGDAFRKASLGIGTTDFVFREGGFTLVSTTAHIGWSWLELVRAGDTRQHNMADVSLGSNIRWGQEGRRSRVGLGFSRKPTATADGSQLLVDLRAELSSNLEQDDFDIGVRGGLSRLSPIQGGAANLRPTMRYGTQFDAYYKLPRGLQIGGYFAWSFEPRGSIDPWTRPRQESAEAGLILRSSWGRAAKHDASKNSPKKPMARVAQ